MLQQTINPQLYSDFGVLESVEKLKAHSNLAKLNQLHQILAKYIITQAITELPEAAIKELAALEIKDSQQLYSFLNKHIPNFSAKMKEYGRRFRTVYPTIANTSYF